MTSFLENVIADLQNKGVDVSNTTFVLPNKRSGVFLRELLTHSVDVPIFAPKIHSIDAFIEGLSEINYGQNIELLFTFYDVYLDITPKEQQESFDAFSKWAQVLLQDFNEIDRYLISPKSIFDYLVSIKEINHWSLAEEQTTFIKNYILFWNRLPLLYDAFKQTLLEHKKGYQGLVYREAVNNLEQYITANPNLNNKIVFIGFNALTKAEEVIIQELIQQDMAIIYWDIDETFIKDSIHDAGLFIRNFKTKWPYFRKHPFNWISGNYSEKKTINIIGAPKQIGQVKYIGELLQELLKIQESLGKTAIVLGNENLLMPLLSSIPIGIGPVNITMGFPLKSIPLTTLFETLFKIHKTRQESLYYKDVVAVLSNTFVKSLFIENGVDHTSNLEHHIQQNNVAYFKIEILKTLCKSKAVLIELLFGSWNDDPKTAIQNVLRLIMLIKQSLGEDKSKNLLTLEYLFRFNLIFNELYTLNSQYSHIENIGALFNIYKEIIANETLDFKGEPLKGLQIMGMLESRALDFETVIITSVNEGILPAGKTQNSFIPFDVKLENGLPTYKEKDAVYTYHFYRLLQRAKNIYILYNTEPDVLRGGEKSRFITQLEIENFHDINHYVVAPKVPSNPKKLKQVIKTAAIIDRLKFIADKGFSPSSLSNYIRNPIDFYYEKVLDIKMFEDVEETVAANTIGTTVHKTLEDFYKPFVNAFLKVEDVQAMKLKIEGTVLKHLKNEYGQGNLTKGKNLIVFEITKRYVLNILNQEIANLQKGDQIKILAIEQNQKVQIEMPELDFPVFLTGNVDRVDEYNGTIRIIDYKTGKVEPSQLKISDWENLNKDYKKYSKSFQVLNYAYMLNTTMPFNNCSVEAGIISFKNLSKGFIKFTENKSTSITQETLDSFFIQFKILILEICNQDIPFTEKPIT